MTPHDLVGAFDAVADCLEGTDRLRELVLQLAVRGKLVPQDPKDEKASALVDRISHNSSSVLPSSKRQADSEFVNVALDKFVIPESWQWSNVEAVTSYVRRGKSPEYADRSSIPVVSQKCVQWSGFDLDRARFITERSCERYEDAQFLQDGDLLWNSTGLGTLGRIIPFVSVRKFARVVADSHVTILRPAINAKYLWIWLAGPLVQGEVNKVASGSTKQTELATKTILAFPVPVPPLAEQQRIVAHVDELMKLLDRLGNAQQASRSTREAARNAALARLQDATSHEEIKMSWDRLERRFDDLCHEPTDVESIRQVVLRLAARGLLLPQDSSDVPVEELLQKMRDQRRLRIGRTKEGENVLRKLSALPPLAQQSGLPSGWALVHLLDAAEMVVDCHNKTAPYVSAGIPLIRTTNIRHGVLDLDGVKFVSEETYSFWSRRCPPRPGDIIFTREAPMGEAAIIPTGLRVCLGQRTMLVRPMEEYVLGRFLLLALTEPGVKEHADRMSVGSTVRHLRVGDVEELRVLIPPLNEQRRIVAKVDQLMSILDKLEAKLTEAQDTQAAFAAAAVHNLDA